MANNNEEPDTEDIILAGIFGKFNGLQQDVDDLLKNEIDLPTIDKNISELENIKKSFLEQYEKCHSTTNQDVINRCNIANNLFNKRYELLLKRLNEKKQTITSGNSVTNSSSSNPVNLSTSSNHVNLSTSGNSVNSSSSGKTVKSLFGSMMNYFNPSIDKKIKKIEKQIQELEKSYKETLSNMSNNNRFNLDKNNKLKTKYNEDLLALTKKKRSLEQEQLSNQLSKQTNGGYKKNKSKRRTKRNKKTKRKTKRR